MQVNVQVRMPMRVLARSQLRLLISGQAKAAPSDQTHLWPTHRKL